MKTASVLILIVCFSTLVATEMAVAKLDDDRPVELGKVEWQRSLKAAETTSKETGKPIFVLFQEVPGCETCQNFGNAPLSHPLMVEAIENLFVPVLIYNNKKEDEAKLKQFSEPSWNNPVVRFLDGTSTDLIQRKDRVWTTNGIANRMVAALKAAKQPVPKYLELVATADSAAKTETAEFAMHCYWEGEAQLGSIPGVLATRSGWREKLEVVEIEFNPEVVGYDKLLKTAQSFDCASKVFTHNSNQQSLASKSVGDKAVMAEGKMRDAKLSDQKYYVRNSIYAHLPLTELQATKINAALYTKQPTDLWLSPNQQQFLKAIEKAKVEDKAAFTDFVWPDDDSKLVAYQERVKAELVKRKLAWAPDFKVPIALVGDFDLNRDGISDRQFLMNLIKKNGGQVVAQQADDGTVIGKIDSKTRYAVVGNFPHDGDKKFQTAMKALLAEAKKNNVQTIDVRKLMNWMGEPVSVQRVDHHLGNEFRKRDSY